MTNQEGRVAAMMLDLVVERLRQWADRVDSVGDDIHAGHPDVTSDAMKRIAAALEEDAGLLAGRLRTQLLRTQLTQ